MGTGAIVGSIDVAQVTLYVFWIFFVGLLWYIRQEDRHPRLRKPFGENLQGHRLAGACGPRDQPMAIGHIKPHFLRNTVILCPAANKDVVCHLGTFQKLHAVKIHS